MTTKRSALRAILDKVYVATSFEDALKVMKELLENPECVIRGTERIMILKKAELTGNLLNLQKYITNSFLRYEGHKIL